MKTFYLFRHGLATHSTNGYGEEIVSAKLLPEAIPAIKSLGNYLVSKPVDFFVSSGFPRCVQTAQIISKQTNATFEIDERLNEYHEISFQEFIKRITYFLQSIENKNYENIWICSHVAVIITIKKLLAHEKIIEKDISSNYPLPGVLTVCSSERIEEMDFNN